MNILALITAILGTAEEIVPIFIHNPKSQQVEGVIATTANGLLSAFPAIAAASSSAAPVSSVQSATTAQPAQ